MVRATKHRLSSRDDLLPHFSEWFSPAVSTLVLKRERGTHEKVFDFSVRSGAR